MVFRLEQLLPTLFGKWTLSRRSSHHRRWSLSWLGVVSSVHKTKDLTELGWLRVVQSIFRQHLRKKVIFYIPFSGVLLCHPFSWWLKQCPPTSTSTRWHDSPQGPYIVAKSNLLNPRWLTIVREACTRPSVTWIRLIIFTWKVCRLRHHATFFNYWLVGVAELL